MTLQSLPLAGPYPGTSRRGDVRGAGCRTRRPDARRTGVEGWTRLAGTVRSHNEPTGLGAVRGPVETSEHIDPGEASFLEHPAQLRRRVQPVRKAERTHGAVSHDDPVVLDARPTVDNLPAHHEKCAVRTFLNPARLVNARDDFL